MTDCFDDGGIGLQFAIDAKGGIAAADDAQGLADEVDFLMLGAAMGGEREERDGGLDADENARGVGGGDGDAGKLFGGGSDDYGAIGKTEESARAEEGFG